VNKQLRALAKEGGLVMEGHQIRVMKQPHSLSPAMAQK
jgi:hypothetical protein